MLANNSGKVKLANDPVNGRDAPIPLTWITYLPATMQNIFELIIMDAVLADHIAVWGTTDSNNSVFIFCLDYSEKVNFLHNNKTIVKYFLVSCNQIIISNSFYVSFILH